MNDNFWVAVSSEKPTVCKKRKRRVGKRIIEFIGWGSRPLIKFLEAIGQDTREKHTQHDVAAFIAKYINEKGLASTEKKKKFLCDERLYALFGKKSMSRIKVFEMLEEHFAENHDDDSDDEILDSSEEEDLREKNSLGSKNNLTGPMKKVPKIPKSCFAAVIPENIKLIYLKKSLIQELLKVPESFEAKIVGSFVRMKSDPNDIYQKNRFQLQQVTGVEKISGGDVVGLEILLRVSNFFKDVPICMLSDDNFSEEEIEDVRDRMKDGLLKRLNVNELELKAQMLHADITNHWIAKELSLLKNRIDHANEKGWRRELFEYIERRNALQNPSEREKLLLKIPVVIAEELEPDCTVIAASDKINESGSSPKSILRGSSDVSSTDASGSAGDSLGPSQAPVRHLHTSSIHNAAIDDIMPLKNPNGSGRSLAPCQAPVSDLHAPSIHNASNDDIMPLKIPYGHEDPFEKPKQVKEIGDQPIVNSVEKGHQEKAKLPSITTNVIDLSDDESDDEASKVKGQSSGEFLDDVIWYYIDPNGQRRGPFSLVSLKKWSDSKYFQSDFKVWKEGETSDNGVFLTDVISRVFLSAP
ncbi:hypothetical protein ABFS82_02G122000 [Erythranthe guttata]|uniref:GYF domain-containing protein n=1 Tax=Erythranthe guttata TaxID=4155 RepID=A0A022QGM0_ERYGU|nr:PREDICTED: uncharacterized protein At5g08430 isoform X1 [Erythranthe guttata]EYU27076.1 hypothetical protein MIMGU_mgv1a003463mg [Erythranthe guttata]|eukprot:XP_012849734.1 PREDICTED: uncharacterized protein At5g08430 isoform X1 [Erythranthe guttata]